MTAPIYAVVFDVEGTLIDCVALTLQCWRETLAAHGHRFEVEELHRYSGMDARLMLPALLHTNDKQLISALLDEQGERYRRHYLDKAQAFPGAPALFSRLAGRGCRLALATTAQRDELRHYLKLLGIVDFVDAAVCGADVAKEKPAPDLIALARERLQLQQDARVWTVGDTPYDVKAALAAGTVPVGTLGGGFGGDALIEAGCVAVAADLQDLERVLFLQFQQAAG